MKIEDKNVAYLSDYREYKTYHDLPRLSQVFLYTIGVAEDMRTLGILEGEGIYPMNEKGWEFYYQMIEDDFAPTEEEAIIAVKYLFGKAEENTKH